MAHVAFARKYRPRSFAEVVGQEAIAQALRGAIASGRTGSVYLFSGSHGVGKTSMARIFAKALNCPAAQEGEPCLACPTCLSIDRGEALDVVEIDAASNRKVEDAEQLRLGVHYRPQGTAYKVYILDEVHQLTRHAFDALLKTFEEAPEHVRFVLATTELHKVPSTIRSRAQVFHFRRAGRGDVELRLSQIAEAEGVTISPEALALVARRARGSMRDAQKMLDQVVTLRPADGGALGPEAVAALLGAFTDDRVERLLDGIAGGDPAALLSEVADHLASGGQVSSFVEELMGALRATLYARTCGPDSELLDAFAYDREVLGRVAQALGEEALLYALQLLADVEQKLRIAREPRVLLEVALVRLARARELRPIGEVLARLERLERALGEGDGPPALLRPAPARPTRGPSGGPAPSEPPPAEPPARPARNPGPERGPGGGGSGPPARGRSYSYPEAMRAPSEARALAEAERAARHTPAAQPAGPLVTPAVREAWLRIQDQLPDALGMAAVELAGADPKIDVDPEGLIRLRVDMGAFAFKQVNDAKNVERLAQLLSDRLGRPARLRLERVEEGGGAAGDGGASGGGPVPIQHEPIVRAAQRELDAFPMEG